MLLSFALPALALTVPVRASYQEEVAPGEVAVASYTTTASVHALSNPETGNTFPVMGDELTANKREASGKETFSFHGTPAGSVRTWALYFIDAGGSELGAPEIVDVSFDAEGNGSIAARSGSSRVSSLSVKASDATSGGLHVAPAKVSVQDSGASAAYVGVVELTNSDANADLATDPDMTILDATLFATFQALDLDAIVALDAYTLQLEGSVTVTGLDVASNGVVEWGTELQWDIAFSKGGVVCEKGGACVPLVSETRSYIEAINPVKKKLGQPPRVSLNNSDVLVLSSDASQSLTIQGDVRDLEVSAAMDVYEAHESVASRDVVALDPFGFGVQARNTDDDDDDTGIIIDIFIDVDTDIIDDDNQAPPPPWTVMADTFFDVAVLDSNGGEVSIQTCQMVPTAATIAGTSKRDVLVGECTSDPSGTEIRRLRASIGSAGRVRWTMDLAGPVFTQERTIAKCEKDGACETSVVTVLGGTVELQRDGAALLTRPLRVTETEFDLPFVLDGNADGLDVALAIELFAPRPVLWSVLDGVVTAKADETIVASFDLEDIGLDAKGDCTFKGWNVTSATVPSGASEGPVVLARQGTGPGRFVCR